MESIMRSNVGSSIRSSVKSSIVISVRSKVINFLKVNSGLQL